MKYKAIAIGCSAGGTQVLSHILSHLSKNFTGPIIIVSHVDSRSDSLLPSLLKNKIAHETILCAPNLSLENNKVYIAPSNHHLYLEPDLKFSLSKDPKVCFSRPSIDVFMESFADTLGPQAIGILLTGANADGAKGLAYLQKMGGTTIVQAPIDAEIPTLPQAALDIMVPDYVKTQKEIPALIEQLYSQRLLITEF